MQPNGDWHISAQRPSYSVGTITITVRTTLSYVDASIYTEDSFELEIVCIEPPLASFFVPSYTYTVGDAALVIPKPSAGSVTADTCTIDCNISFLDAGSNSAWFTDQSTQYEVLTSDLAIVSQ